MTYDNAIALQKQEGAVGIQFMRLVVGVYDGMDGFVLVLRGVYGG
jgi:hypothetical protein